MGRTCSTYGKEEKYIQNFGMKPDKRRPPGRNERRWEDNI
jgi:hypothetical protein